MITYVYRGHVECYLKTHLTLFLDPYIIFKCLSVCAQVYHMHCFCCSSCEKHLVPGENFGVSSGKLFCKSDYDLLQQHEPLDSPTGKRVNSCLPLSSPLSPPPSLSPPLSPSIKPHCTKNALIISYLKVAMGNCDRGAKLVARRQ